jgi:hypothetical protein
LGVGRSHPSASVPILHARIPQAISEPPRASHFTMADLAVDAGLIRKVRKAAITPAVALANALDERLQPLAVRSEHFIAPFTVCLNDDPQRGMSLTHDDPPDPPLADGYLFVWKTHGKNFPVRYLGPKLTEWEAQHKGSSEAIHALLWELWDYHGPGVWTTDAAFDGAQSCYWWNVDFAPNLRDTPEVRRDMAQVIREEHGVEGTDDEVLANAQMPMPWQFRSPSWKLRRIRSEHHFPAELHPIVLECFALLTRIEKLMPRRTDGHRMRTACLDDSGRFDAKSWQSAIPFALLWEDGDPSLQVLDDLNNNDFQSGEMVMEMAAAFGFSKDKPETLARAVERCALWFELLDIGTRLALAVSTEHGAMPKEEGTRLGKSESVTVAIAWEWMKSCCSEATQNAAMKAA